MIQGKIVLAGAGPGDVELVTVKTARYLQMADIIIADRLVSRELLYTYANPNARLLFVGKEGNGPGSMSQSTINQLLVKNYAPHKLIVRLKGGDVAFFSNVLAELKTLVDNGIPFEIVPGITAASGASAYSGIPLTARGYSKGVRFLTYYKEEKWSARYWQDLASTSETLVLYMSAKRLSEFTQNLLYHGALPGKPIAVIEQATTSFQKVYTFTLQDAVQRQRQYKSPSLVIVGEVVKLHEQFSWNDPEAEGRFFEPAIYNTF